MKKLAPLVLAVLLALPLRAFVIETEEGRKERDACVARIQAVFDFRVVDESIRALVADLKEVDGVMLKRTVLADTWTPHDRQFRSGSWWLSYEGGEKCSLTIYFNQKTKTLES